MKPHKIKVRLPIPPPLRIIYLIFISALQNIYSTLMHLGTSLGTNSIELRPTRLHKHKATET